jgi:hypothetical protein
MLLVHVGRMARTAAPWSLIAEVALREAILIAQDRDQCAAHRDI